MGCCGGDSHGAGHGNGQEEKHGQNGGGITWTQVLALLLIVVFILSLLMRM